MKLEDSVAVVTGASRGVGRATAVVLAGAGVHVVCTARSTASAPSKVPGTIEETVRQVQALGRRALAVRCDVSQQDQVEALAQRTLAEFGRIDILVNNAAANYWAPFADMPMKRWDLVMKVNLRGAVLCTKAFLPRMVQQRSGRIVNVSSGAAVDPEIAASYTMLAYAVSKAGLEMFTRGLGLELRPHQIAVNSLRIETYVATEGAVMFNPEADCSTWDKPETAGEYILWLATRESDFTGHVMTMAEVRQAAQQQ
jgi:citronellol/citronellal dehydrogenase